MEVQGAKKAKKKGIKAPSVRMVKTAKAMVGKGGKSFAQAAREAGYSEAIVNTPAKITKSKSWQALMDEYLPQDLIARKHQELLEAEETIFIPRGKEILERKRPDHMARRAGIDMAHKLRGNYAPEKIELERRKFQDMSDEELRTTIVEAKKILLKK